MILLTRETNRGKHVIIGFKLQIKGGLIGRLTGDSLSRGDTVNRKRR